VITTGYGVSRIGIGVKVFSTLGDAVEGLGAPVPTGAGVGLIEELYVVGK
jgi:hypothetical protein